MSRVLTFEQWLPAARPKVFQFFADAHNLEELTPSWLKFKVLTPKPVAMRQGALIDYRLKLHGVPLRWQSEITLWEPEERFIDEQRCGPYRKWIHLHSFQELNEGTLCIDRVEYAVPGGVLVDRLFVRRDVEAIFAFRRQALQMRFGPALV